MIEAVTYVERNQYGSVVVTGTGTHVTAIGFAYEGGYSEDELLDWFHLSKEQLHGVLAYFYGHRDELLEDEAKASELAKKLSNNGLEKLKEWKKKKSS